ncbi:MAG TPA: NADH-quinone oxidoreductase subunit H [Euzebyales bacterium]|nr:NADH-quinone oxidoreductase subunit H [Euzebyales bacterium]
MTEVTALSPAPAVALVAVVLAVGAYLVAVADRVLFALVAGQRSTLATTVTAPAREAMALIRRQPVTTEAPDTILRVWAPAAYAGLAAMTLSVVPLAPGVAVADVRTGIVVFGAAEALAIVAIFLHGWAPNSALPLVAGYRLVGVALSYELLSMFVLIAAALPAESLSIGAIVASQQSVWNVVRQPLGLPLFLVVAAGVTFTGPLGVVDATDLAGGGATEASGVPRLVWSAARAAMLVSFATAAAAVFLGGWFGPVLPGAVWMALKTAGVAVTVLAGRHLLARVSPERFVRVAWTVLLPLAFADLAIAGVVSLW